MLFYSRNRKTLQFACEFQQRGALRKSVTVYHVVIRTLVCESSGFSKIDSSPPIAAIRVLLSQKVREIPFLRRF